METQELDEQGRAGWQRAVEHARHFADEHGWQLGVLEMALGAGLLAWGIQDGVIDMGTQLVASVLDHGTTEGAIGAATGGALGVLPGLVLKSIGVAAMGTAFSVPAVVLMGGGALLMGLAGYGAGRLAADFLHPAPSLGEFIGPACLAAVGVALLLDGARRLARDEELRGAVSRFADGVLYLRHLPLQQVLDNREALLASLSAELTALSKSPVGMGGVATATAAGAAAGSALAAGSVTVVGSHALGGAALALGLVSAPVWPVVVGGAAAGGAAYAAWRWWRKSGTESPEFQMPVLPRMTPLAIEFDPPIGDK
ncbi:hypothetical protein F7Q92_18425 [Ideonella dechloratans]|uniref:Uncharacterized protein n=1 Tax=Ideonella dechloratans TaxID=36863 RepID=A0A643F8K2_IDEDE|nr:hypothetical protein [Ideonella dechloratans]KAB0575671.1 hypothetical protein F7Q92_18425 [Ideonella dechloratans]UFU11475.1 hypothetical protein LRM40_07350 [Ideonella dechloratans]